MQRILTAVLGATVVGLAVAAVASPYQPASDVVEPGVGDRLRLPGPADILRAGFDALWAVQADPDGGHRRPAVLRIDPTTGRIVAKLDGSDAAPGERASCCLIGNGLAVSEDAVWTTGEGRRPVLYRIDPANNRIVARIRLRGIRPREKDGLQPGMIVSGAGSLWVRNFDGGRQSDASNVDGSVTRVSPRTNRVISAVSTGPCPADIAFGAGAVWVVDACDRTLARIHPRRNRIVATVRLRGGEPGRVTVGPGAVWVVSEDPGRVRTVWRVAPRTNKVVDTIRFRQPESYTPFGGGAPPVLVQDELWISSGHGGSTITRLDARNGKVIGRLKPGGGPHEMAVIGDAVFVSTVRDRSLVRIDLSPKR